MNKRPILLISVILILILAGCSNDPQNLATPRSADTQPPSTGQGFSIHLLEGKISPGEIDPDQPVKLEAQPLISMDDIAAYSSSTHEIQLTQQGYEKIHALKVPTNGMAFVVSVDGDPIYDGAFWVLYSSLSYDGIVIDPLHATADDPTLQINLGYPGSTFFQGEDPRSDPRIMAALKEAGKLN